MNFVNKCLENDNNVVRFVAFICKYNPMSYAGNNYRMLLNAKKRACDNQTIISME